MKNDGYNQLDNYLIRSRTSYLEMNQNMPLMDANGAREDSRDRTKRKRETNIIKKMDF
ncbi:hypothetical protein NC652_016485 [Populus alba x Populus x berolinensis]|nr:hypothetical protein NC652_016485 [Populus alba x Populus x berolinensis]